MQVTLLDKARIEREWPAIADLLWPAIRQDPTFDSEWLRKALLDGTALAFEGSDGASGLWVVQVSEDAGELVAWTIALAGKIDGGPKERLAKMRHAVGALERTLKTAGVKAHRICGRDWSAILPDYSPLSGVRHDIEKRL